MQNPSPQPRPKRVGALLGLNLILMTIVLFGLAFLPPPGARSVIVVPRPFGLSAAAIVAQADGVVLREGIAGAMLARGDAPDFVVRLYAHGALLVLDGKALQGCAS